MAPLALTALGGVGEGTEIVAAGGRAIVAGSRSVGAAVARGARPRMIGYLMELVSSQGIHTAEELGLKGSQEAARQEIAAAAQTGVRTGVEQLEEKIAQITRRTVNSVVTAVAAAKGYDSVKINSNGTVTGKYTPIGSRIAVSTTCGDKGCTTN